MFRTKRRAVSRGALLLSLGLAFACRRGDPAPSHPAISIQLDGVTWRETFQWDFRDGLFPQGWYWGTWRLADGMLEGRDPQAKIAVYFLPFRHGGDFVLETKVRMIESLGEQRIDVQLLTRDSRRVDFESGMNLYDAGNTVTVRHMAKKVNYVWVNFPVPVTLGRGDPHVMRFAVYRGAVSAYLDGTEVYRSDGPYPVGHYSEPHLAVESGVARFEYLKIFEPQ